MSTNQTPNYALNQWEAEDQVLREEFNADNRKIDAAILAARTAPCCVTGSYAGGTEADGATVNLGFRPSFVMILRGARPNDSSAYVAAIGSGDWAKFLCLTLSSSQELSSIVAVTDTGFTVTDDDDDRYGLNYSGTTYYYAAFY